MVDGMTRRARGSLPAGPSPYPKEDSWKRFASTQTP